MYACMYVCMCVCMYVRMYVCMYVCTYMYKAHKNGDLSKSVYSVVWSKLLDCIKNRIAGHLLSNNGLCLHTAVQLLVTIFNKGGKFGKFYGVTWSCSSWPFLCALGTCMYVCSLIFFSIMLIDSLYSFAFLGIQGG